MNPDEILKTGSLITERVCPPGLSYKSRKHWHHQKKFYHKIAGMQEEWPGFSDDEEEPAEAPKDRSEHVKFIGFADEIDDRPIPFPRIEKLRTSKNTFSEDENVDEVTAHHRLTNNREIPSSHVVKPVVPLLGRDLSHSRKLRKRSSPPTAIGRVSRHAPLKTRARSLRTLRVIPKHARLRLRVQRQQERSNSISHHAAPPNLSQSQTRCPSAKNLSSKNASTQTILPYSSTASILLEEADQISSEDRGLHNSSSVAHGNSMLATAFPSPTIGPCAMRAVPSSGIAPAKPTAFFPALGQHSPADVLAVTSSTRALIIDSSLSVAASSKNIDGVALDGHLRSEFAAQVQLFDSIPATALQIPVDRPAVDSNAYMQVSPRPLADVTINEIIDADNTLMLTIPGYELCPRKKLLELQEICLHHLDITFLAIVSGDLELSNDPDLELGGLDLLVEHGIQLD
ncbi:uncharacterized protein Bfra_007851sa [Botrytis fragariae]|uniref:Uncharacterized protein n=1 Tax=Botrytis fragariae TaxID=1964551 RepID=A0A8H6EGS0_9HELO|nr:uncharacterized protein Bfra_007851sa [Botrytis fragariae]KAF5871335.1 hypothetical protein Bfra_007851sa [Botrytis fragariae]